jgi:crotonobetainyl-CoA:carnitine CoA-transferase CaiB-like acyl-CoA transferase
MIQLGEPNRTPLLANSRTMTAFVPGVMGAIAAVAGYLQASRTGRGVKLDLSEHEALLFNTRYNETYYSYTGTEIKRHGKSFAGWSPTYRVFDAADGFVSCAASTDAQVELFLQLAGINLNRLRRVSSATSAPKSWWSNSTTGPAPEAATRSSIRRNNGACRWAKSPPSTR